MIKVDVGNVYRLKNGMILSIVEYINYYANQMPYKSDRTYRDDAILAEAENEFIYFNSEGIPNFEREKSYKIDKKLPKEDYPEYFL